MIAARALRSIVSVVRAAGLATWSATIVFYIVALAQPNRTGGLVAVGDFADRGFFFFTHLVLSG
jgi:hypothetical protein